MRLRRNVFLRGMKVRSDQRAPEVRAIYVCPGDPYNSPRGGQTAFAVQALNAFGGAFALVAPDESGRLPIGEWTLDAWKGSPIWRFNVGSYAPRNKGVRPLIPRRVVFRRLIARRLDAICSLGVRNIFCDSPELLGVLRRRSWDSFCYRFAGLNNPVGVSRYPVLRALAGLFHRRMIRNLAALRPDALLASADRATIREFEDANPTLTAVRRLSFFPTRFDPSVYYPGDAEAEANKLGWGDAYPRLTTVGRLCWVKGLDLALEAVAALRQEYPAISLRFVGDGEERERLSRKVEALGLTGAVIFDGFLPPSETRRRVVAANLYLVASHREGWSVALAEALACGKRIVSTRVSGAGEAISEGENGFIAVTRDVDEYASAIRRALKLTTGSGETSAVSVQKSKRYSLDGLADEWRSLWAPLREG